MNSRKEISPLLVGLALAVLLALWLCVPRARAATTILSATGTNQFSTTNSFVVQGTWQQGLIYSSSTGITNAPYYVTNVPPSGVTNIVNSITNANSLLLQLSADGTNFAPPVQAFYLWTTNALGTVSATITLQNPAFFWRLATAGTNQGCQFQAITTP